MTQKSVLYITLFNTTSGVKLLSWILSQLNILCTCLVRLYYTKNNDSPVIHRSLFTAISRRLLRTGVNHIGVKWSTLYQNVHYLISS